MPARDINTLINVIESNPNAEFTDEERVILGNYTQIIKLGGDIDGESADDHSGRSVSLSADGTVVAICSEYNDGNDTYDSKRGHVRIYEWIDISNSWTQRGGDIDGESAADHSGWSVSLSSDGNVVAISAKWNDGNTSNNCGHVRVYEWTNGSWTQRGGDIDGEAYFDESGWSVSLSANGNVVAIGARVNNGGNNYQSGHVRIYEWKKFTSDMCGNYTYDSLTQNNTEPTNKPIIIANNNPPVENNFYWTQRGGDIDGEAAGDQSGYSVSLSADGTVVAIGAQNNDGNGNDSGHVRIYEWKKFTSDMCGNYTFDSLIQDTSNPAPIIITNYQSPVENNFYWTQRGGDIDGEAAGDNSGYSVSLSANGNVVAIGARGNNGGRGHVRIYNWEDGTWTQRGGDIDGEAGDDQSGHSVSLSSDGDVVAIGTPYNNDEQGANNGHVRIYEWKKFTSDMCGNYTYDSLIQNVSNTKPIIITTNNEPTIGNYYWTQRGSDIDGETEQFWSGYSVSLSKNGNIVAIGAIYNVNNLGNVRIYEIQSPYSYLLEPQSVLQKTNVNKLLFLRPSDTQSRQTTLLINRRAHNGTNDIFSQNNLYQITDSSADTRMLRLKIKHIR
jgi:hypothetical protein